MHWLAGQRALCGFYTMALCGTASSLNSAETPPQLTRWSQPQFRSLVIVMTACPLICDDMRHSGNTLSQQSLWLRVELDDKRLFRNFVERRSANNPVSFANRSAQAKNSRQIRTKIIEILRQFEVLFLDLKRTLQPKITTIKSDPLNLFGSKSNDYAIRISAIKVWSKGRHWSAINPSEFINTHPIKNTS